MSIKVKDADGVDKYYETIEVGDLTSPFQPIVPDFKIAQAINQIQDTYGDTVSVWKKSKSLIKFGLNNNLGTSRGTIWFTGQDQANETDVAINTNPIDTVSSGDPADTMDITIEGFTQSGGDNTFVVQTKTLTGQTKAVLTTPLHSITRIGVNGLVNNLGEIYGYQDTPLTSGKPSDTTKIHITVPAGENQSRKASTSISSVDYWIVTGYSGGSLEKSGTNTTEVQLEVRESGGTWKIKSRPIVFQTGNDKERKFDPYIIVPKNSDVRLTGLTSAAGQSTNGDISGYLAIIT